MADHRYPDLDVQIATLINSEAGVATALDGSDKQVGSSDDVRHEALVALLRGADGGTPQPAG